VSQQDQCDEGVLSRFNSCIEHGQRERHADGGEAVGEAETVQQAEAEGDEPRVTYRETGLSSPDPHHLRTAAHPAPVAP
jgi:hypothetical protein